MAPPIATGGASHNDTVAERRGAGSIGNSCIPPGHRVHHLPEVSLCRVAHKFVAVDGEETTRRGNDAARSLGLGLQSQHAQTCLGMASIC